MSMKNFNRLILLPKDKETQKHTSYNQAVITCYIKSDNKFAFI